VTPRLFESATLTPLAESGQKAISTSSDGTSPWILAALVAVSFAVGWVVTRRLGRRRLAGT
jgi:hypothetical protein